MLNVGHRFCSVLFDTVHLLNAFRNQAKTYRVLLGRISPEAAAGGLEGGRDHYAFGGQLPAHSATSLNTWLCNIQRIPSVFQDLAQWKVSRGMINVISLVSKLFSLSLPEGILPLLETAPYTIQILKICWKKVRFTDIHRKNQINKASYEINKTGLKTTGCQIKH